MKSPVDLSRALLQSAEEQAKRSKSHTRTATTIRSALNTEDWSEAEVEILLRAAALFEGLGSNYKKSSSLKAEELTKRESRAKAILSELLSSPLFSQPDLATRLCLIRHVNVRVPQRVPGD